MAEKRTPRRKKKMESRYLTCFVRGKNIPIKILKKGKLQRLKQTDLV